VFGILYWALGGSIPMGTLIKCSPNCGPSGGGSAALVRFVVAVGGADAVVLQLQPPWRQLSPLYAKWGRQIIKTRPNAVVRLKALHCQMSLNTTPLGPNTAPLRPTPQPSSIRPPADPQSQLDFICAALFAAFSFSFHFSMSMLRYPIFLY